MRLRVVVVGGAVRGSARGRPPLALRGLRARPAAARPRLQVTKPPPSKCNFVGTKVGACAYNNTNGHRTTKTDNSDDFSKH